MTKSQVKENKRPKKKPPSQRGNGGQIIVFTHHCRWWLCRDSRTKRNSAAQCGTQKQVRTLSVYSHSFTFVCRGANSFVSSLVVDLGRLTAESCRMSSRRRLRQTLGQIRKLFAARGRAVSFLSRGQTERVSRLRTVRNGCQNDQLASLMPGLRNES